MIAGLGLTALLMACTTQVGPSGDWLNYTIANGFCITWDGLGIEGELGHCGKGDDPNDPTP